MKPHERRAIANRETDGVIYPPGWVSAVRLIVHRAGRRNLETAHPSTAFDVWGAVIRHLRRRTSVSPCRRALRHRATVHPGPRPCSRRRVLWLCDRQTAAKRNEKLMNARVAGVVNWCRSSRGQQRDTLRIPTLSSGNRVCSRSANIQFVVTDRPRSSPVSDKFRAHTLHFPSVTSRPQRKA